MDSKQTEELDELERYLKRDYDDDRDAHDDATKDFDAYEAMGMGRSYDQTSKTTKNGLTDSATATIYLERAARVAAQLPSGQTVAFGKKDTGKAMLMDLLRQKWIYPHANAQRPFRTKMFLWQYGSSQYGYMPMYYDLDVKPDGKVVPDCWLWNPRNFIPQNGFTTISDMDYCHAIAYKSPRFFEDLLEEDDDAGWEKDKIREIIDSIKQRRRETDPQRDTQNFREHQKQSIKQIAVVTRYEAGKKGRWVTFLPDYGYRVIRSIKNPHKNGKIPFVIKPCIPSFDTFYNVGDFQRSMPMQFANDGLDNFYFEGIKINLFPPIIINPNGVVKHTVKQGAGKVWQESVPNSIRRLDTSVAGLSTYQAAKGMAKGAIQSIAGTTDTAMNADKAMDPGFGKTPDALKMIQQKESTRDNQDRQILEEAMNELIDGLMSLLPTMKVEDIPVDLFGQEIQDIIDAGYVDVTEIIENGGTMGDVEKEMKQYMQKAGAGMTVSESGQTMKLRIDPKKLKGLEYHFDLDPNSTAKKSKQEQADSLMQFIQMVGALPNALQQYQQSTGKVPNWDSIFTTIGSLTDVPGLANVFVQAPPQPPAQPAMGEASGGAAPASAEGDVAPDAASDAASAVQSGATPQPQMVGGMPFQDPEIAAQAAQLEAMKG